MMLVDSGVDPADVRIGPVPGSAAAGASFGVAAADALERGTIDGFWANGMGAEVAVRRHVGTVVVDARRGDGPPGTRNFTFAALSTTRVRATEARSEAEAMTRAVLTAQRLLRADPSLAESAVEGLFPAFEASLIAELVARDAPFYEPAISPTSLTSMSAFAGRLGLAATPPDDLVPAFAALAWCR
jgi:ABC-type nitrate/sulfonate/bicarbonate transport system substrate-binding protein